MLKYLLCFLIIVSFSFSFSQEKKNYVEGEVLVQFKPGFGPTDFEKEFQKTEIGLHFEYVYPQISVVSKNVNIFKFRFNPEFSHENLMEVLKGLDIVQLTQLNHYVESRATTPNDTEFGSQWQFENTGQTGGTAGNDISATDAWDITTGGLTAHGDTIVVCVIEEQGGNMYLPDLAPNHWKNNHEIPDNGIDDDNNGYIDDYNGWNVQTLSDSIGSGNHGTQVASMIGAKGDNNIGGSGINWDVKIMMMKGLIVQSEASVLSCYDYPLTMRKMYNSSNGQKGAFVVATNASWGINNGQPADYPLWTAFYDTMGVHGILSAGATSNSAIDVDLFGDMPTACPSDYLISVTATDHNDSRNFAGYGQTTIDLAAPGQNTHLMTSSGNWGNATGTSFATPAVAGTIALMYSLDCQSFMALVKSDPAAAALMVKQALLDGVDNVPSLATETVTGGRLNAHQALLELGSQCDTNACTYAYSVQTSGITDTTATITWDGISNEYWFYFREAGSPTFDSIFITGTSISYDTLTFCTDYEFYLITDCDTAFSIPTVLYTLRTDGCCENPAIQVDTIEANSVSFFWDGVYSVNDYDLRYRIIGSPNWTEITGLTDTFYTAMNLDSCEMYEIQIRANCSQIATSYSGSMEFESKGCGACYDQQYCDAGPGDADLEWIERLVLNDIDYTSGNNNGYLFYRHSNDNFKFKWELCNCRNSGLFRVQFQ